MGRRGRQPAFTLIEVLLVLSLLALLTGWVTPALFGHLKSRKLTESASQFRSLLVITRAHAMSTGKRFRIRWDEEQQQPIVEYEPEPIDGPGEFAPYEAEWTADEILLGGVHCHEVNLGRPVYLEVYDENADEGSFGSNDAVEQEELRPEVVFDPTGNVEWATFVLADAELGEMLEDTERELVVLDGRTGDVSIRPPLTEQELAEAGIDRQKLLRKVNEEDHETMTDQEPAVAEQEEGTTAGPAESAATDQELSPDELAEIEEAMRRAGGGR